MFMEMVKYKNKTNTKYIFVSQIRLHRNGKQRSFYLWPVQADDSVHIPGAVIEIGDGDGMLAGGHPVFLGIGVDLEDMRPCAVDRLLPEWDKEEMVNFFVPQHRGLTKPTGWTCTARKSEDHLPGLHLSFSRNQRNSGGPTHQARFIGVPCYGALDKQIQVA